MNHKKRFFIVFLASLVGLIFSLQNLIPFSAAYRNPQLFFTPFNGGDENLYAAEIREVFEGKFFSGDAFIHEAKSLPPFLPWLGPLIFGLLAKVSGSLESVFVIADFLLPAFIFLLIFKLVWQLSRHYWGSIIAGLATLFLYQLTTKFPPITTDLLQGFWQALTLKTPYFFSFNRLIPPQFTFIIFLFFLVSIYQTTTSIKRHWSLLTGFFSGILAYLYFYHWSAALVILIISFLFSLASSSKVSKRLGLALLISLVISSGYLKQIFLISNLDKQISFGRINGRFFEPLTTLRYGLALLIIYLAPLARPLKQLLLSIFWAAIILMNLQLIIGFTIAPGHWPHSTFEPLLVLSGVILLATSFKKYFPDIKPLGLLIVPILLYAIINQFKITKTWQSLYQLTLAEKQLFSWINSQTLPDSVILTLNKRLNRYLPVLTHDNIYLPYGSYSQLSTDQLWDRINLAFSFYQFKPASLLDFLNQTQFVGQLFDQTYNYHYRRDLANLVFPSKIKARIADQHPVFTFGVRYIPDNIKQANITKVSQLLKLPLKQRLCQYKLDYLLLTDSDKQLMTQTLPSDIFNLVFEVDNLSVYQLKPGLCQP